MGGYAFHHVPGIFVPTVWEADIDHAFGRQAPDWAAFERQIEELKSSLSSEEFLKVMFTARHGEAEHNILAAKYGLTETEAHRQYPIIDPPLTPLGRQQAERLAIAFQREARRGMPLPTRWFVSPMRRPGETAGLTWSWMFPNVEECKRGGMSHGVPAIVVEEIREHLHVHRCDERLPVRELKQLFPSYDWPLGMPDDDTVWHPTGRETEDEMVARAGRGLAIVMDQCHEDTYVSLTAHSGLLRAVYKNLGVPLRRLVTGEMNVLVLRVQRR